ncbi:hypothetical protein PIB30_076648 [Stylosanthes scabra]|uniref:Uncharacterized protein n=1 Tax=Stylosanthes scabra TaxID=79078 RepID=A0ABU6VSZ3_9FABA|nr:hypothetical protein [Stylosanthes scabra]
MALARPHPPGGTAARSENAILLATGATAPPRPSYGAPARLAHPRDGLGTPHGAATPLSWRTRTARAFAQWPWSVRALALGALRKGPARATRPRAPNGAPVRAHYHAFLDPIARCASAMASTP